MRFISTYPGFLALFINAYKALAVQLILDWALKKLTSCSDWNFFFIVIVIDILQICTEHFPTMFTFEMSKVTLKLNVQRCLTFWQRSLTTTGKWATARWQCFTSHNDAEQCFLSLPSFHAVAFQSPIVDLLHTGFARSHVYKSIQKVPLYLTLQTNKKRLYLVKN